MYSTYLFIKLFLFNSKRSQSPETKPKQEPIDDDDRIANGSGEGMDVDTMETDADLVKETYNLPSPAPLTFLRYPILKPDAASNLDLILNVCLPISLNFIQFVV